MQKLQLPDYGFRTRQGRGKQWIFDEFRRKWVVLTPEEWVRQHFLKYLVAVKKVPPALMAVEKQLSVNNLSQRFDLLVYDRQGNPWMIGEFKAPEVAINQGVFDQAVRYNAVVKAPYFVISNGLSHYVCRIDFVTRRVDYLEAVPEFG